jgi:peptidoglycan hydrolase CwlO-like protein
MAKTRLSLRGAQMDPQLKSNLLDIMDAVNNMSSEMDELKKKITQQSAEIENLKKGVK